MTQETEGRNNSEPDPGRLLREREAACLLGLSHRTLQGLRCRGGGPPFVRIGRRAIGYRHSDLLAWISENTHQSTSQYPS